MLVRFCFRRFLAFLVLVRVSFFFISFGYLVRFTPRSVEVIGIQIYEGWLNVMTHT